MTNAIIFSGIFLLLVGFVAAGEALADWYWTRRRGRRIATAHSGLRNDKRGVR